MSNKVVVAIVTFYPKPEGTRFCLACLTIGNALAAGHKVVVVDGSPANIGECFKSLGALVFPQHHRGLGSAKRQSAFHALEVAMAENLDIILMDEAEKDLSMVIPELIAPIISGEAGVCVLGRTEEAWKSWPEFQQKSEQAANAVFAKVTGKELDIMMGPVAFSWDFVHFFVSNDPKAAGVDDNYIQHYGTLSAIKNGVPVVGVKTDWRYPEVQRAEESTALVGAMLAKRQAQLDKLTHAYPILWRLGR